MEQWEQMDRSLHDLIEIMHFTEDVSAKIHGLLDEAEIYRAVRDAFAGSERYDASILLLTDDGAALRVAETSLASDKLRAVEQATGLRVATYGMVHPVVKERELFVVSLIASLPSQGQVCPQMWSE